MEKILIVDDSRAVRLNVRQELSRHDFIIKEAESGEKALTMISSFKPDLITLDIEMMGLDGFAVCSRIRNLPPPLNMTPVIFLTGHDSIEKRFHGFESGATEFYSKQFKKGELLKAVQSVLNPVDSENNVTVLVADDNKSVQILIRHCLKGIAERILSADSGSEAFEIFKNEKSNINCVITDFEMPGMRGDELCRLIRKEEKRRTLPVIFLTALSGTEEILNIYRSGGSDYITKPFIREEFIARVNIHLQANINASALEDQVLDLRQVILSRNFQFNEEKKQFAQDLEKLINNCKVLLGPGSKNTEIPPELKKLQKKSESLLEKIKQTLQVE